MTQFEYQIDRYLQNRYHEFAGISESAFINSLIPFKPIAESYETDVWNAETGKIPFIIVPAHTVENELIMKQVKRKGKEGVAKLYPLSSNSFSNLQDEYIPLHSAYLLTTIDRGMQTLNVTPRDALHIIRTQNRHPLTVLEGVLITLLYPEFLQRNNCYSLLASRHDGDKRVPAIWLNSKDQPNLGWCWEGNPHTWLGSASCTSRLTQQ